MAVSKDSSRIRCAIFDWNGTLVNDAHRAWKAISVVLEQRHLDVPSFAAFSSTFRLPIASWLTTLGVPDVDLRACENDWNTEMIKSSVRLQAGAKGFLEHLALRGTRLVIVSAASVKLLDHDLSRLNIKDLFSEFHGSVRSKRIVLRRVAGDHPASTVYVGDTEYDVEEGLAAGLYTVGFAGGYRTAESLRSAGANVVVESIAELAQSLALLDPTILLEEAEAAPPSVGEKDLPGSQ